MTLDLSLGFWQKNYDGIPIFVHNISGNFAMTFNILNTINNRLYYGDGTYSNFAGGYYTPTKNYIGNKQCKVSLRRAENCDTLNLTSYNDQPTDKRLYILFKNIKDVVSMRLDNIPLTPFKIDSNDLPNLTSLALTYSHTYVYKTNSANFTNATSLNTLEIRNSGISAIDLSNITNLSYLTLEQNTSLSSLNLTNNTNLYFLETSYNSFSNITMNAVNYPLFSKAYIELNSGVSLNFSKFPNVMFLELILHGNSINLSNNKYIKQLNVLTVSPSPISTLVKSISSQSDPFGNQDKIFINIMNSTNSETSFDISNYKDKIIALDLYGSTIGDIIHYKIYNDGFTVSQEWVFLNTTHIDVRNTDITPSNLSSLIVDVAASSNGGIDYQGALFLPDSVIDNSNNFTFTDPWTSQIGVTYVVENSIASLVNNGWIVNPIQIMTKYNKYINGIFFYPIDNSSSTSSEISEVDLMTLNPLKPPVIGYSGMVKKGNIGNGDRFAYYANNSRTFQIYQGGSYQSPSMLYLDANNQNNTATCGTFLSSPRLTISPDPQYSNNTYYIERVGWNIVSQGYTQNTTFLSQDISILPCGANVQSIYQLQGNFVEINFDSSTSSAISTPNALSYSSVDISTGTEYDTITIYGTGMLSVSSVKFDGNEVYNLTLIDDTQMQVVVPLGNSGTTVNIDLFSYYNGTITATSAFTYL